MGILAKLIIKILKNRSMNIFQTALRYSSATVDPGGANDERPHSSPIFFTSMQFRQKIMQVTTGLAHRPPPWGWCPAKKS